MSLKNKELARNVEYALQKYDEALWKYPHIVEKIRKNLSNKSLQELEKNDKSVQELEKIDKNRLKQYPSDINAAEYWAGIIISKIQVIEIIGGTSLLDEICRDLTDRYRPTYNQFLNEI